MTPALLKALSVVFWVAIAVSIFHFGGLLAEGAALAIALTMEFIRRRRTRA